MKNEKEKKCGEVKEIMIQHKQDIIKISQKKQQEMRQRDHPVMMSL